VVDAEGYDWNIVKQAIDFGLRPKIILFEHSNLDSKQKDEAVKTLEEYYIVDNVGIDYLCKIRST